MDWRIKCFAHHLLGMPGIRRSYYMAQRLSGSGFLRVTDTYLRLHQWHIENYKRVHPGRALEFGGGRHFLSPLLLSHAGATEVLVYDIERLSSAAQINHTIRQLRAFVSGEWPEVDDCDADLGRKYRIRYCAPGDARSTGLPDSSVDFICSTSTLEHIPLEDIRRIFAECARIATPRSVFSHVIDYKDHYSYSDSSVSAFNFYRFGDRAWRWLNPSGHFQNRLRHSDYEALFAGAGLLPMKIQPWLANEIDVPISRMFGRYSKSDLLTHSAYFLMCR